MSRSDGPAKSCIKMRRVVIVASSLLLVATAGSLRAETKDSSTHSSDYELKFQDLKYVFGPLPPFLRVHAGAEMVDPNYVIVAKINKKFLPAATTRK